MLSIFFLLIELDLYYVSITCLVLEKYIEGHATPFLKPTHCVN